MVASEREGIATVLKGIYGILGGGPSLIRIPDKKCILIMFFFLSTKIISNFEVTITLMESPLMKDL